MKATQVRKILNASLKELTDYRKNGDIRAEKLQNGFYEYNEEDVMSLAEKRMICIGYVKSDSATESIQKLNSWHTSKTYQIYVDDVNSDRNFLEIMKRIENESNIKEFVIDSKTIIPMNGIVFKNILKEKEIEFIVV